MKQDEYIIGKKEPGVTAILNLIIPGLGFIYCERILLGIISIVIISLLYYLKITGVLYHSLHYSDYKAANTAIKIAIPLCYILSTYFGLYMARGIYPSIFTKAANRKRSK